MMHVTRSVLIADFGFTVEDFMTMVREERIPGTAYVERDVEAGGIRLEW